MNKSSPDYVYTNRGNTMQITIKINDDQIRNLLCTALEGGANYWYDALDYKLSEGLTLDDFRSDGRDGLGGKHTIPDEYWHPSQLVPFVEDCAIVIRDALELNEGSGDDVRYSIDRSKLQRGLQIMAENSPRHFADFLNDQADATTGDVFLQYVCFGEVVYG